MTAIVDELAKKKGGKFYTVSDLVGQPFTVLEDVGYMMDIRMDETLKWYVFSVSVNGEEKPIHLPRGALRELADTLPRQGSWKGYTVQIDAVLGKGYNIKYKMHVVSPPNPQQSLGVPALAPSPAPAPAAVSDENLLAVLLSKLKSNTVGVHDSRLAEWANVVLSMDGHGTISVSKAAELTQMLKYSGRIRQEEGGVWKAVS